MLKLKRKTYFLFKGTKIIVTPHKKKKKRKIVIRLFKKNTHHIIFAHMSEVETVIKHKTIILKKIITVLSWFLNNL